MNANPDCLACAFQQALRAARVASPDPTVQLAILEKAADALQNPSFDQTPAELSQVVYEIARTVAGRPDPYAEAKRESNAAALRLLPQLEALVHAAPDPLRAAVRLAAAGNVIDLGIDHGFDPARELPAFLEQPFAIEHWDDFRRDLAPGRRLLYLGDNAGEIVFDRVLVEHLLHAGLRITFAVKSAPILNDATLEDARACGLTDLVPVVTTGGGDIGLRWDRLSAPFRQALAEADVILAKGHGHFETCAGHPGNFYFLLKAKCRMVARELGVDLGAIVLKHEG